LEQIQEADLMRGFTVASIVSRARISHGLFQWICEVEIVAIGRLESCALEQLSRA
jgi:hypothetical protein